MGGAHMVPRRRTDDDLSARVSSAQVDRKGPRGSVSSSWRLDSEVRKGRTVGYWMGVARVGRWVTQVLLTPVDGADVRTVSIKGEEWQEVDFPEDVEAAKALTARWAG